MVGTEPVGGQLVAFLTRREMGLAAYEIIGNNAEWRVRDDGRPKTYTRQRKPPSKLQLLRLLSRYGRDTRYAFLRGAVDERVA
jgi:hypothetical protein